MHDFVERTVHDSLNKIANTYLAIVGIIAAPSVLVRESIVGHGWLSFESSALALLIGLGLPLVLKREHISLEWKAAFIPLSLVVAGCISIHSSGPAAGSAAVFLTAALFSQLFYGSKIAWTVLVVCIALHLAFPTEAQATAWEPTILLQSIRVPQNLGSSMALMVFGPVLLSVTKILRDDINAALALLLEGNRKLQRLRDQARMYHTVADFAFDWEMWVGADDRLLYVSPACRRVTEYEPEELTNRPTILRDMVHPEDLLAYDAHSVATNRSIDGSAVDFRIFTKSGEEKWVEQRRQPVTGENGGFLGYVITNRECTARKKAADDASFHATHDSLTGLPNRRLVLDRLDRAVATAARDGHKTALIYIDLDDFKAINDSLGHAEGDRVIKAVADRLAATVRDSDTAGRVGGDEFVILLPKERVREGAIAFVDKLEKALRGVGAGTSRSQEVRASIGFAMYPDDADSVESLLEAADGAMYAAKKQHKEEPQGPA